MVPPAARLVSAGATRLEQLHVLGGVAGLFAAADVQLAKQVIEGDRYIDDVCEQMLRELLTYMFEDPSTISRALPRLLSMHPCCG